MNNHLTASHTLDKAHYIKKKEGENMTKGEQVNQLIIEKSIKQFYNTYNIKPTNRHTEGLTKTLEAIIGYNKPSDEYTVIWVSTLDPGLGKTRITEMAVANIHKYDRLNCGTIILTERQDTCDEMAKEINLFAGAEIAIAFHQDSKTPRESLQEYPVIILCHNRFIYGIEKLDNSIWKYYKKLADVSHAQMQYTRNRLVIDESINRFEELSISNNSLASLDSFFQGLGSTDVYHSWQNDVRNPIDKMFVLPPNPEERDTTVFINAIALDKNKARELNELIKTRGNDDIRKAYKAIMNFSENGGLLRRSTTPQYRQIHVKCHSDIFQKQIFPTTVILDATAKIDKTYEHLRCCNIIELPQIKSYEDVNIHIDKRSSGSKSAILGNHTIIAKTIEFINTNLQDKTTLVITHKDFVPRFESQELPKKVRIAYWGSFSGTNEFNDCDCIVICGMPHLQESSYIHQYHAFSDDNDYNKSMIFKSTKNDRVLRFIHEPAYESIRQSYLAVSLVQTINRGVCRNTGNTIPMHVYLLYNDFEVVDIIKSELVGVNVFVENWLPGDIATSQPRTNGIPTLEEAIANVLINHNKYFGEEKAIGKTEVFKLEAIRTTYPCKSKARRTQVWQSPEIDSLLQNHILLIKHHTVVFIDSTA